MEKNGSTDLSLNQNDIISVNKVSAFDTSLEEFTQNAFKIFVDATKSANKLPFGKNRDLYESCSAFHTILKNHEQYVLSTLSSIMKFSDSKGNFKKKDDEDKFEMVIDVNDSLIEKVSMSLDEISGAQKNTEPNLISKKLGNQNRSWNNKNQMSSNNYSQILNLITSKAKNMEKPQLKFSDKVNNDEATLFEPKIKYKYNLLKPLSINVIKNKNGICEYSHPYEFELLKFKPPEAQLKHKEPILYKTLEEVPLKRIEVKEDVSQMVQDLEKYNEIAVDMEHHSHRSFQGFTCLLQISTRDTDYIIDTLLLRSDLEELNKVFTNPNIVKVLHGADSDILWLQRDFSLYIVNMFDTHQAARLLNYSGSSLAYLLKMYCDVNAQKHFQLADWRIRPLPEELLTYAREDTHYLLFIYDQLRNKLIDKGNGQTNLLESVIQESTRICLKTYKKPIFDKDGYLDIYQRSKKLFDNRQKSALQKLFEWRDKTARELDESYTYVLPNHMMLNISETLPREAQGILACCNPVPHPVRQNLLHLHQLILDARDEPLIKPVLEEQQFHRHGSSLNSTDNPLHCPHDLNHEEEFRDDLPVLLVKNTNPHSDSTTDAEVKAENCVEPIVDVFEKSTSLQVFKDDKATLLNPYARYKLAKIYSESLITQNKETGDLEKQESGGSKTNKSQKIEDLTGPITQIKDTAADNSEAKTKSVIEKDKSSKTVTKEPCKRGLAEVSEVPSKKPKVTPGNANKRSRNILAKTDECLKPKGKRKQHKKAQEKEFVPYNYEAANFDSYKSYNAPQKKKPVKGFRRKGKNKTKNFKISI